MNCSSFQLNENKSKKKKGKREKSGQKLVNNQNQVLIFVAV